MKFKTTILLTAILILTFEASAQAYIGPGLGGGTLTVVLGFLASIFLALFAVIWYPVKRLVRKMKSSGKKSESNGDI